MFKSLREFLDHLENQGDLLKIDEALSPIHEIHAVLKYVDKGAGPAVLFPNVRGYQVPVVGNLLGRRRRLAMALGVEEEQIVEEYYRRRQQIHKPRVVADGPIKEVVIQDEIDITKVIPVLTHHAKDAGPYFSSAVTIARDPETGVQGMGIHRIQVKDQNTLGLFLATPPLSVYLKKAEERNQPLDIAVVIGMDPDIFCFGNMGTPGFESSILLGALAQQPIELVKCATVDPLVPHRQSLCWKDVFCQMCVIPRVLFGESSGYYFTYQNPVARSRLLCIAKTLFTRLLCLVAGRIHSYGCGLGSR